MISSLLELFGDIFGRERVKAINARESEGSRVCIHYFPLSHSSLFPSLISVHNPGKTRQYFRRDWELPFFFVFLFHSVLNNFLLRRLSRTSSLTNTVFEHRTRIPKNVSGSFLPGFCPVRIGSCWKWSVLFALRFLLSLPSFDFWLSRPKEEPPFPLSCSENV